MTGNFLKKQGREPSRGSTLLDLLFTEKDLWEMWCLEAVLGIVASK